MDLNLNNKITIVTGGAKGIGEAITRSVAAEGGIPVILGRSKEAGENLKKDLSDNGQEALALCYELSPAENCEVAVSTVIEKYGRIDALVNNAGVNDGIGLEKGQPKQFRYSVESNLFHYYYMAHYCFPGLKKSEGSIVNISSKTAITGQGNTSGYAAAKGAQLALTREWAVELLKHNIRVNAIVPAEVMTPLYRKWLDTFDEPGEKQMEIEKNIPLGNRMTTAKEISDMAVFLISQRASHITGQQIFVDGGYSHLDRSLSGLGE